MSLDIRGFHFKDTDFIGSVNPIPAINKYIRFCEKLHFLKKGWGYKVRAYRIHVHAG